MSSSRSKGAVLCIGGLLLSLSVAVSAAAPTAKSQDVAVTFLDLREQKVTPDDAIISFGGARRLPDRIQNASQYFSDVEARKLGVLFAGKGDTQNPIEVVLPKPRRNRLVWVTLQVTDDGDLKQMWIKTERLQKNRRQADFGTLTLQAGGPPNDDCADAIAIGDGSHAFSTIGASTDGPSHSGSCQFDGQTYNDVWFVYTASCDGEATISTCGTADYDTDLVVYDGSDCNSLVLLDCNDDTSGCSGFTSEVEVPVVAGNEYLVRVGGFASGDSGTGTLNVSCAVPPAPPSNDDCATPLAVPCNSSTTVDNSLATVDPGDPVTCRIGGGVGQGTIWFEFTADGPSAFIETNNSAVSDTVLSLFSGSCGGLTLLACSEDEGDGLLSEISINTLTDNETYLIMVASYNEFSLGEITLDITCPAPEGACCFPDGHCSDEIKAECLAEGGEWDPTTTCASNPCPQPPPNDECADAEAIPSLPAKMEFDNTVAVTDPLELCGVFSGPFQNVWYSFVGTGNTVTITTCNAETEVTDTKIAVYCRDCSDLLCITGNDDNCPDFLPFSSTVTFPTQAGSTYLVTIGNFSSFTAGGIIVADFDDDGIPAVGAVDCAPQGACCLPGGSCVVTNAVDCGDLGGTYVGDSTVCGSELVNDGGFELGPFAGAWIESSTNFGTPICDTFFCGTGTSPDPTVDGDFWCWFGGISGVSETGSVIQVNSIVGKDV